MSDDAGVNAPAPPRPLSAAEIVAWLEYEFAPLLAKRAELIAALAATAKAYPTIQSDEEQGIAAENVRMGQGLNRVAGTHRETAKQPYLHGGRAVDAWFASFGKPVAEAVMPITKAMLEYADRKEAESRRLAAIEAERLRAEADAAKAAAAKPPLDFSEEEDARIAEAQRKESEAREAARLAQARPAEHTQVRGGYGAVASVRQTWSWEISDLSKVPRKFLMVDPDKIKEAAKQRDPSGKPTAVIAGIAWVPSRKIGIR